MGPLVGKKNNTVEKEKAFLAFIDNVFLLNGSDSLHRGIQLLKDGRIICYCYSVKIYKYTTFSLLYYILFGKIIGWRFPYRSGGVNYGFSAYSRA